MALNHQAEAPIFLALVVVRVFWVAVPSNPPALVQKMGTTSAEYTRRGAKDILSAYNVYH